MKNFLQVGEVAKLLGVTPKTIRYYQRLGLLAENPRSNSGYRLFNASDLMRLRYIKRLQDLGMSLNQIKSVLGKPQADHEVTLRVVLQTILSEVNTEISQLEARRNQLQGLLNQDVLGELDQPFDALPTIRLAKEKLGKKFEELSPATLEMETKLWNKLDSFQWPENQRQLWTQFFDLLAGNEELVKKAFSLEERLVAIKDLPANSPQIVQLAEDFYQFGREFPQIMAFDEQFSKNNVFSKIFMDLTQSDTTPAQQRLIEVLLEMTNQN